MQYSDPYSGTIHIINHSCSYYYLDVDFCKNADTAMNEAPSAVE